jgi:hypothetical protein
MIPAQDWPHRWLPSDAPHTHTTTIAQTCLDAYAALSPSEQHRATQKLAMCEAWTFWSPGGFHFADGSVLRPVPSGWEALSADEASTETQAQLRQPLELRLCHSFVSHDGRECRSIAEARLEPRADDVGWRLVVHYEAYMASPLYGFQTQHVTALLELPLLALRVDTHLANQRWRLERIASHPDWLELLLISSRPGHVI